MTAPFDYRTRSADDLRPETIGAFVERLPELLAERGELAGRALADSGLDSFTLAVDGVEHTWRRDGLGRLVVVAGDPGDGPRADLPAEWFSDIVNDQRSAVALMISALPVMTRGRIEHLIRWEKSLRALVDGRPTLGADGLAFTDGAGQALDLHDSFDLDDDPEVMARFLDQAGYLVIRGVVGSDDLEELGAEMDEWFATMTPDDPHAWYAEVDDGAGRKAQECVRVTNLRREELRFAFREHLEPVAAVTGCDHGYGSSDLLRKPVGVVEGLSDLPWHRDCELGMHSYRCASVNIGLSVTASGPDNGALGVIAGSHRVNAGLLDVDRVDLPTVYLATAPGDVTVHLSCTLHRATPPLVSERRVTYSNFRLPGDTDALDRKIKAVRDQAGRDTYAPT